MSTSTGKAARRKWGTKANAKRARTHSHRDFGTPEQEKVAYRELKRKRRKRG